MEHGKLSSYKHYKCRCNLCKEANRLSSSNRRKTLGAKPRGSTDLPHGTWSRYSNKGCRCDACKLAAKEYRLAYHKANPMKESQSRHKRRARMKEVLHIPVGTQELQLKFDMYPGCWICGTGPKEVWDHVKPLAKGGAHCLANLRPACKKCNSFKRAKWPFSTSLNHIQIN